jgi:hypothetical protein
MGLRLLLAFAALAAGCSDTTHTKDAGADGMRGAPDAMARDAARHDAALRDADLGADSAQPIDAANDAALDVDARTETSKPPPRVRASLVDPALWMPISASDDPFDDAPPDVSCDPAAYGSEFFSTELAFFVKTRNCPYLVARQPSLVAIEPGDRIDVRVWFFPLTGPAGSESHIAMMVGDQTVFDERIPNPADVGGLLRTHFVADAAIAAGTDVFLHIHNHGANSYDLLELSTGPKD